MSGIGSNGRRASILACLAVLVGGCEEGSPRADSGGSVEAAAMFRGGPEHRGAFETEGVERLGRLKWRFETAGAVRSSPVLHDGRVYFGSADGCFYALDAETGEPAWSFHGDSAIVSTPAVAGGSVFFGDRANRVFALDARSGRLRWRVETGEDIPWEWGWEGWDYFTSSPAVSAGTVLIGSGDGHLYALAAASGEERWRFATGGRIRSSPAVAGGTVYFGSADGILYAVDLATGLERWRHETDGRAMSSREFGWDRKTITSSPAVTPEAIFFGSRDGKLYALERGSGVRLWDFPDGPSWVIASPAVADGVVYSGRSDVFLFRALDAGSGEELWKHDTGGYVYSSPAVVGDSVYVGSGSGWLFAFDRTTGAIRWRYRTGGAVFSSPWPAEGILYFGSDDGHLYALEAAVGPSPRRAVFWDDRLMNLSVVGGREEHRAAADYFEHWDYERLDSAALISFLEARVADRAPSVVVFAMDALPGKAASPPLAESLFRRYLEAGGKAAWLGFAPFFVVRDEQGRVTGVDREAPGQLLDVDHQEYSTDHYSVAVTEAGRRWGLEDGWVGGQAVAAGEVSEILARDELGRAVSWAKSYGGPPGTGFVQLPFSIEEGDLDRLRLAAEYGVLRPAGLSPAAGR